MSTDPKQNVLRWRKDISVAREAVGVTKTDYSDEFVFAMIWVESDPKGDPNSNRRGSKYHGLLQAGPKNGIDTGMPDRGQRTTEPLMGNGRKAIIQFFQYQERYSHLHDYEPRMMALLWKGGPTTLETYKELRDEEGIEPAEEYLASKWGGSSLIYLKNRFPAAYNMFSDSASMAYVEESTLRSQIDSSSFSARPPNRRWSGDVRRNHAGKKLKIEGVTLPLGCEDFTPNASRFPSPQQSSNYTSAVEGRAPSREVRGGAERVLRYVSKNYYSDLDKVFKTWDAYNIIEKRGFTDAKLKQLRGFVEDAKGGVSGFKFRSLLLNIAVNFVQPLVNPIIRNPWGQERGTLAGPDRQPIVDPNTGEPLSRYHFGIDYETRQSINPLGVEQACYAIADGEVFRSYVSESYGNAMYIDHGNGITTRYAHLSKRRFDEGQAVARGEVIGNTGTTEGIAQDGSALNPSGFTPHLHFEIRFNISAMKGGSPSSLILNQNNVSIDPAPILAAAPNPGEAKEKVSEELLMLEEARQQYFKIAAQANDSATVAGAAALADLASAVERGVRFSELTRYDYYEQQARNSEAQTIFTKDVNGSNL